MPNLRKCLLLPILTALLLTLVGCTGGSMGLLGGSLTLSSAGARGLAQQVFDLTQAERRDAGRAELTWNDQLAQAAQAHADDMSRRDYFAHESPEGGTVGDRTTQAGYDWAWIGENIAAGQTSAEQVMQEWMGSPGHKKNILFNEFTEMGVAVSANGAGRLYWVQVFGKPRS